MIGIMIDQKLEQHVNLVKQSCDFMFETLGYPFKYVNNLDYDREGDIIFLCSLASPPKDEMIRLANKGVVVHLQLEPDLFITSKLSREYIESNIREIQLFNKFPVIAHRDFDNPMEIIKSPSYYWGKINFDLLGNIYFHLAGTDEHFGGQFDNYGRLTEESLPFFSYARVAYVNNMLWMIDSFIKEIVKENPTLSICKKEFWPQGEDFAFSISHNVDRLQKWDTKSLLGSTISDIYLLISLKFPAFIRSVKEKIVYLITNTEYYWRFEDIGQILSKNSLKSTWFVAALDEADEGELIDYCFNDPDLHEELRNILNQNCEVALLTDIAKLNKDIYHGHYKELVNQKKRMVNLFTGRIKGIRNIIGTLPDEALKEHYDKLDFHYDAGISFADQVGFRNGVAFPYQPFLPSQKEKSNHWAIPLVFSDHYLQITKHKLVSKAKAMDIIKNLINTIKETNGLLTLNFSMSNFHDISYAPDLLEYTIGLLKARNTFSGTLEELTDWWVRRKNVDIKEDKGKIVLISPENIDKMTINLLGNRTVSKINGADSVIVDNVITLNNIKKDVNVVIYYKHDDQMYVSMDADENTSNSG